MHFSATIKQQQLKKAVKYKAMYGVFFFHIESLLSLKNVWLPQILILNTKSTCCVLLSPHGFKPRKNIPVLVGTTHRKLEYLEMRRSYVQ